MKIVTYKCDICLEEITDLRGMIGVRFSDNHKFLLDNYKSTDGVHICIRCATQLQNQLTNKDICDTFGI